MPAVSQGLREERAPPLEADRYGHDPAGVEDSFTCLPCPRNIEGPYPHALIVFLRLLNHKNASGTALAIPTASSIPDRARALLSLGFSLIAPR